MRIIIADCEVIYEGRGSTTLNRGNRAIIIKGDGAVSIHSNFGNKPLNYMGKGNALVITKKGKKQTWVFYDKKESITVTIFKIHHEIEHVLDEVEEGLIREKTENQFQAWLARNPEAVGKGFTLVGREYRTPVGAVDIVMKSPEGEHVIIEVKRKAMIDAVSQLQRYMKYFEDSNELGQVRGMIVAKDIRPKTLMLAEKYGFECIEIIN